MMLYKDTKAMVGSADGDTDFFVIVAWVLQRDTLVLILFITLACDVFKVEYIIADFKVVFFYWIQNLYLFFLSRSIF